MEKGLANTLKRIIVLSGHSRLALRYPHQKHEPVCTLPCAVHTNDVQFRYEV
jgi:hypothetical protein